MLRDTSGRFVSTKPPISISTNAHDVANAFHLLARRIEDGLGDVTEQVANLALKEAQELSSGSITYAQMAADGHPYRVGGGGYGIPWVINVHTDTFRSGWRIERGTQVGFMTQGGPVSFRAYHGTGSRGSSRLVFLLMNEAIAQQNSGGTIPYRDIIGTGGAGHMMGRPIVEHITMNISDRVDAMVARWGRNVINFQEIGQSRR